MDRESLTFRTFRNISYSVLGYIWPMLFALFVTPIVIFRLGVRNYGIYLFVNTIISLLGLLDFGVSIAVTKYLSSYYGKRDDRSLTALIRSANSIFWITGLAGLIIFVLISFFGPSFLPTQFASYKQYSMLFLIAGGIFFVTSVGATYTIIMNALQRFDISNKIGVVQLTISSLSILAVVLINQSLQTIFLVQLIINALFVFITFYYAKKILKETTLQLGWDKKEIKSFYKFGAIISINGIASTALASLDRLIIPLFIGPSNLTYYSVPGNVTSKIPGFANNFSTILFPMTSQLEGSKDQEKIETLYVRSFRLITIVAASLTVTAIAFAHKILLYWLSADFANRSGDILIILALTNFILALFGPLSNFLIGLGKIKFLTAISIIMGVANAALLLILLPRYAILGAAWAYLLSVLPVIYMFYYTEKKYLSLSGRRRYYSRKIIGTIVTSVLVWILDVYILSRFVVNLPTLLLGGGVSILAYLLTYKLLGFFEQEDWRDIEFFYQEAMSFFKLKRKS